MSISFTAKVVATVTYLDEEGIPEHVSDVLESTLDLGNFRAYRTIINNSEDYCGSKELSVKDAIEWLHKAEKNAGFQCKLALDYITELDRCFSSDSPDSTNSVKVLVVWG